MVLDSFSTKPPLLFVIDQNPVRGDLNLHAPNNKFTILLQAEHGSPYAFHNQQDAESNSLAL